MRLLSCSRVPRDTLNAVSWTTAHSSCVELDAMIGVVSGAVRPGGCACRHCRSRALAGTLGDGRLSSGFCVCHKVCVFFSKAPLEVTPAALIQRACGQRDSEGCARCDWGCEASRALGPWWAGTAAPVRYVRCMTVAPVRRDLAHIQSPWCGALGSAVHIGDLGLMLCRLVHGRPHVSVQAPQSGVPTAPGPPQLFNAKWAVWSRTSVI